MLKLFKLLAVFSLAAFYIIPFTTILAEEATPSSQSAEFKEKLKSLEEEIASKAAKLKQEVSKKIQDRVFIGRVKYISEDFLEIETAKGTKKALVKDFTVFLGKGVKAFSSIKEGDYIASLGDIDGNSTLTSKTIIRLIPETKRQIFFGQSLPSLKKGTIIIRQKDGQEQSFLIKKDTLYLNNIASGSAVIIVATVNNGENTARSIYTFPQRQIQEGSPSAF